MMLHDVEPVFANADLSGENSDVTSTDNINKVPLKEPNLEGATTILPDISRLEGAGEYMLKQGPGAGEGIEKGQGVLQSEKLPDSDQLRGAGKYVIEQGKAASKYVTEQGQKFLKMVLGICGWAMNRIINYGSVGAGQKAATPFFIMFLLIAGAVEAVSCLFGLNHVKSWVPESRPAAAAAAAIAWSLTILALGYVIELAQARCGQNCVPQRPRDYSELACSRIDPCKQNPNIPPEVQELQKTPSQTVERVEEKDMVLLGSESEALKQVMIDPTIADLKEQILTAIQYFNTIQQNLRCIQDAVNKASTEMS